MSLDESFEQMDHFLDHHFAIVEQGIADFLTGRKDGDEIAAVTGLALAVNNLHGLAQAQRGAIKILLAQVAQMNEFLMNVAAAADDESE